MEHIEYGIHDYSKADNDNCASNNTSRLSFSDLPGEVRNLIYEYAVVAKGADDYEDVVDMDGCEGIVKIEDMDPQEWRRAEVNGRYRTPYRIKRKGQKGRTQTSYVLRLPYSSDPKRCRSAVPTMVNMLLLDKQTHWEAASHGGYVPLVSQLLTITPQKMQWTSSTSYGKVIYDVLGLGSMTDGLAVPNGVGGHRIKDCVAARGIKAWAKAISRSSGSSAVFEQALEREGPTPDQELDWLLAGLYEMVMRPSIDTYGDGTLLVFPGFTIKERDAPEVFAPVSDEALRDKGYRVLRKGIGSRVPVGS
ncbi:hypothetical protein OEA41_008022 [Lepraria neglecta]|uniref:Uncharacterized protein n=1 Tax=Lepraria neglecta TaxID=209136 RepID=A0AAE0DNT2_9LECA|nr:hypothetical protein OEA41_008022 [Lepraria neglecta]